MALYIDGVEVLDSPVFIGTPVVLDNQLFTWGTDSDGVIVLNSAGLSANEELAGVIVGTSVTRATTANSLLFSNITSDGDMAFYVNDGGNSIMLMYLDGSISQMFIDASTLATKAIDLFGNLTFQINGARVSAKNTDNNYVWGAARNTGDTLVETWRNQGATVSYFSMGSSQQFKFYSNGKAELKGIVGYGAEVDLVISSGAIAITQTYHSLIPEGGTGAGADQLDTATGGSEGDILILKPNVSAGSDVITVADGTGANTFILAGAANFTMDHIDDRLTCVHNGTEWVEISRSNNS